jgi:uncharacterized protein YfkK (UPF0435 family)
VVDLVSIIVGGAVGIAAGLAAPAKKAISKLIGAAGDIQVAKLKAKTQQIKDKTEADSVLSKALAKAAADRAVKDPELVERTLQRMATEELSKQENREAVARIALEHLSSLRPEDVPQEAEDVDDDWLNLFGVHAEKASSERLRDLWARVLAGEVRKKGSFSPSTMQMIAVLDADIARLFESISGLVANGRQIFFEENFRIGDGYMCLKELAAAGLLFDDQGSSNIFDMKEKIGHIYHFGAYSILLEKKENDKFNVPIFLLTKSGREIFSILNVVTQPSDIERLAKFVKHASQNKGVVKWGISAKAPDGRLGIYNPIEIPDQPLTDGLFG